MNHDGEEEDVKPSVEYLESLNDYRKRSRSAEDIGEGSGMSKIPRAAHETPEASIAPVVQIADVEMVTTEVAVEVTTVVVDDPMVTGTLI